MAVLEFTHTTATDDRLEDAIQASAEANPILAMFDATSVGLGFVDCDFRIIRINEALASVCGISAADLIGRLAADVVPDIWPQIELLYRQVIDHNQPVVNIQMTRRSASAGKPTQHWLCSHHLVRSADTVIGIGIVAIEITERIEAEHQ